ncbi:integrase family protein [Bradyrhizobium sp. BRP22]|uniref:tyrosine-type recombinase/integrase n=1 Tax=Bradyrhizobium sp. BRP22 TaxID=2793821 RepID=UPI001CD5CB24|nr:integrase family protein [Bradyrhizobium sp. BRP22]MCA1457747.1 integrase family protein [Bradyrhizobium sp. BRP22]
MSRRIERIDFTDFKIRSLKPAHKPDKDGKPIVVAKDYYDDRVRGLILRVNPEGTVTWRVMWYLSDGRTRVTKLGRYPVMSIAQARDKAIDFLRDPQKALAEDVPSLFQDVAETFITKHVKEGGLLTGDVMEQRIRKHLIPAFRDQEFALVRRASLVKHLDDTIKSPSMRDAILTIFRTMANYYALNLDPTEEYVNPVIRGMAKYDKRARTRILSDEEIVVLWRVTAEMGTFGALCRFLLLTGQRREKTNQFEWEHLRDGVWHLPVIKGAKGHPAEIKLPPLALEIAEAQPEIYKCPFVFAAARGKGAFNAWGQMTEALQDRMRQHLPHMRPFTIHDLRRTFRTKLDTLKPAIPFEVKEHAIGHAVGSKVSRTYSHYDFLPEIAQAVAALNSYVSNLVNPPPANVVRLRTKRSRQN